MRKRVVLPISTIDVLLQFGDISDVTNRILDLVESEEIALSNLIANPTPETTKKITIHITNRWYIENCSYMNISLKRLLQHFVDNELFNEFNWTLSHHRKNDAFIALSYAQEYLMKCVTLSDKYKDRILDIATQLSELCEEIRNERIVSD